MMFSYLKSTQYIFTWLALAIVWVMSPASAATMFLISCGICASLMIGRGLIQMNTGSTVPAWLSPEFQFLVVCYVLAIYAYIADDLGRMHVVLGLAGIQAVFNVARGMAEHYRAENPLILR